jgi:TIGR03009 family protein
MSMRRAGFVLASVLSAAPLALAQQQPPLQPVGGFGGQPAGGGAKPTGGTSPGAAVPASIPKPDEATMKHLDGWEGAMKNVKTFFADATLVDREVALKREVQFTARLYLSKPNLVRMDVTKVLPKGQPPTLADSKMYISTGKMLYEYDGAAKKRRSAPIGPNGAGGNLLLDIMSGMSAKQVTDRFQVGTIKQDADYVYLEVKPVFQVDKEEFESLQLILCGAKFGGRAYIPRRVILTKAGGQQTETWDFDDPRVNPDGFKPEFFDPPDPKKLGMTDEVVQAPRPAPGGATPTGSGGLKAPASGSGR